MPRKKKVVKEIKEQLGASAHLSEEDKLKDEIRRLYVSGKPVKEIEKMYEGKVAERTIYHWADTLGWKEEKAYLDDLLQKQKESLQFLQDPNTTNDAIAKANLRVLLQIQGMHLANTVYRMNAGLPVFDVSDQLQKVSAALEKLTKTKHSMENGGKDEKTVKHLHLDMNKALELALEARKKGVNMTVEEAAKALEKQIMETSDDGKSA